MFLALIHYIIPSFKVKKSLSKSVLCYTRHPTGSSDGEAQDVDGAPPKTLDDDANAKINDQEVLTDVEVVKGAYDYFNKFKGLVVDMIFSFQERSDSRNYLLQRTALDALRVIEVELNFIYQAFYTKASVITNKVGFFFRLGSFASLVAALVVFVYDQKRGSNPFDVKVTYTLLYGAVALDLASEDFLSSSVNIKIQSFWSNGCFFSHNHCSNGSLNPMYSITLLSTKRSFLLCRQYDTKLNPEMDSDHLRTNMNLHNIL